MQLSYGGYTHDDNEVWFSITKRAVYGPRNRREREKQRWDIWGVLVAEDIPTLTNKIAALEDGYSTNNQDLHFIGTDHTLTSANTLNGTIVERLEWLPGNRGIWGSGTEYVNKRSYHIVILADTLWFDENLYFYQSKFSYVGTTGPKKIWMPSLMGVPQQQTVQAFTTQKVIQSGMNIGLIDYIPIDAPMWGPGYEHMDRRQVSRDFPLEQNLNTNLKFPTRWTYFFEAPVSLNG